MCVCVEVVVGVRFRLYNGLLALTASVWGGWGNWGVRTLHTYFDILQARLANVLITFVCVIILTEHHLQYPKDCS
jgi:hypothetical protein